MQKYCKDCKYNKRDVIRHGNNAQVTDFCEHPDYRDVVSGQPLPSGMVRSEVRFCGFEGVGFEGKENENTSGDDGIHVRVALP